MNILKINIDYEEYYLSSSIKKNNIQMFELENNRKFEGWFLIKTHADGF